VLDKIDIAQVIFSGRGNGSSIVTVATTWRGITRARIQVFGCRSSHRIESGRRKV